MIFFHVNEAELYHFSLARDHRNNGRTLDIKYLSISFSIEQSKPSKFITDNEGILYYTTDKGDLQFVEYDHSFINSTVSKVTSFSKRCA